MGRQHHSRCQLIDSAIILWYVYSSVNGPTFNNGVSEFTENYCSVYPQSVLDTLERLGHIIPSDIKAFEFEIEFDTHLDLMIAYGN